MVLLMKDKKVLIMVIFLTRVEEHLEKAPTFYRIDLRTSSGRRYLYNTLSLVLGHCIEEIGEFGSCALAGVSRAQSKGQFHVFVKEYSFPGQV